MSNIPTLETKAKNEYKLGIDGQNKWTWHFCNKAPLQLYSVKPKKQNKTKQKGAKMRWRVRKKYFKQIKVLPDKQLKRSNAKSHVEYYMMYYDTEEEAESNMYSDFKQFLMTKYQGGSSKTLESCARATRQNSDGYTND